MMLWYTILQIVGRVRRGGGPGGPQRLREHQVGAADAAGGAEQEARHLSTYINTTNE